MKETIKKSLVGGLVFSITTIGVFVVYAIGTYSLPNKVGTGSGLLVTQWNNMVDSIDNLNSRSVPSGAIMAFNLTGCPTNWSVYTPAQGRFLRGIDPTGTNDTANRPLGDLQADDFKSHNHGGAVFGTSWAAYMFAQGGYSIGAGNQLNVGGNETRPKNVAVLYCVKD